MDRKFASTFAARFWYHRLTRKAYQMIRNIIWDVDGTLFDTYPAPIS